MPFDPLLGHLVIPRPRVPRVFQNTYQGLFCHLCHMVENGSKCVISVFHIQKEWSLIYSVVFFISSITLYSQSIPSAIFMQLLSSLGFMERMIVLAAYIHANLISISVQSLARVVSNVLHDQHLNLSHSTSTYLYNTLVPVAPHWIHVE